MLRSLHQVIRLLIVGDLFMFSGFALIGPIFAVYISDRIPNGSISAAGFAATIFLITQSLLKIPISRYTDREPGNRGEAWTLVAGTVMQALVPVFYLLSKDVTHIYLTQVLYGAGYALAYPGWMAMFTRFVGKNQEGFAWSVYSTMNGIGSGAAAAIGGYVAESFGFPILFYFVFLAGLLSALSYVLLLWYTVRDGRGVRVRK